MAAAYAAVASLMNTMENIQFNHPRLFISSFDNQQFQSLHEIVVFFENFLEESRQLDEVLESQISAAAHVAEDVLESHVVDQILAVESHANAMDQILRSINRIFICLLLPIHCIFTKKSSSFLLDLQEVIEDMDSIKEKVREVMKGKEVVAYNMHQQPTNPMPAAISSRVSTTEKSSIVGFDDHLNQLMDMLVGQRSSLQIIPITGMGGIGKTTLANSVYHNLAVLEHFDFRAWAVVTPQCDVRKILVQLLSCLKNQEISDQITEVCDLGLQLYQFLLGRRYLIVLDDVWSIEAWDQLKCYIPDSNNSSRLVVTTRDSNVARHFGRLSLVMNFLDEDQSWDLLCVKAFGRNDVCPRELERIGKQIARKCKGLPLSIVVIGGLLRKSNRSQQYWENVADAINPILLDSREEESCLNILSLSYTHLPAHLKPCFIYIGIFRKNHELLDSRIVDLWVAEGFLKPNKTQSLREVAYGYLQDLVDRNLIHSLGHRWLGQRFKTNKIHDLLRNFCLRVGKKEKLLCHARVLNNLDIDYESRVVFSKSQLEEDYHPIVVDALRERLLGPALLCHGDKLRERLERFRRSSTDPLKPIFQQVRYISFESSTRSSTSNCRLLSSISLLWNLQKLVIKGSIQRFDAPSEIWEMRQLRHVEVCNLHIPDPPTSGQLVDDAVLLNLQTLGDILNVNLSEEVCRRIPNIELLAMTYNLPSNTVSNYHLYNLVHFHKLESLECEFRGLSNPDTLLHNLAFPNSLSELCLIGSKLPWEYLQIIGSLPHLRVLQLGEQAVVGREWSPIEGQFLQLRYLGINCCDLIDWNADNSHFPVLENLVLIGLDKFNGIPSSIGDIPTLQRINVAWCSESVAISAVKILEEQLSYENEDIQVQVAFEKTTEFERFLVEPRTLKIRNLRCFVARKQQKDQAIISRRRNQTQRELRRNQPNITKL